ncbi:hypothetical protein [Terrabacter sp. BE26]|uniref:hypothetical protein n=1 Tax=Terrabacter sp. BE26 TaxID=2898152 RepID=UPI0035BE8D55
MARSVVASARRIVRRAATWRPKYDGTESLDVGRLISPFRYDVVVRAQLFDAVATRPQGQPVDDFVASVAHHPYAVWFRDVELRRFFPWVLEDPHEVAAAYAARVRRAIGTFESFRERGFDAGEPIMLRRLARPAASDSGVLLPRVLHLGDGGHRLALLHRTGARLEPWMHRVDPRPSRVIDNTAVLAPALRLSEGEYASFLALSFLDEPVDSLDALASGVGQACPQRLAELEALVSAQWRDPGQP